MEHGMHACMAAKLVCLGAAAYSPDISAGTTEPAAGGVTGLKAHRAELWWLPEEL